MRIAIAGLSLESVSFLPRYIGIDDFRRSETTGVALIEKYQGTNKTMVGFIKVPFSVQTSTEMTTSVSSV